MTRHIVIFVYLTVRIVANGSTFSDKSFVESTPGVIADFDTLSHFIQGALKCCPHANLTYNPSKRVCQNSSADVNSEWKNQQFNRTTVGILSCDNDKVLVDYKIVVSFKQNKTLGTTEESSAHTNESVSSIDCDNSKCDGSNNQTSPLESTDYDLSLENSSNHSGMATERTTRLDSARAQYEISSRGSVAKEGGDSNLAATFLADGRLRIGGQIYGSDGFCVDVRGEEESTLYLTARVCEQADRWCRDNRTCVRKCCPDGENMIGRDLLQRPNVTKKSRICHPYSLGFPIMEDLDLRLPVGVYGGEVCGKRHKYILKPSMAQDKWHLQPDGSLLLPEIGDIGPTFFPHTEYCLETVYSPKDNYDGIYAYLCFPDTGKNNDVGGLEHKIDAVMVDVVYGVAILISCVFLVATLGAYAILPSLRNLHGVTLVSHACCLLAAFLCLATAKFIRHAYRGESQCKVLGFSILFAFLAAFSWLNVMCFDIWWTFGQGRVGSKPGARGGSAKSGGALQGNLRKFIIYSIYAWTLPLTITALTALADVYGKGFLPYTPPRIGEVKCWFQDDGEWAVIIHFVGPSTVLLVADMIMFTLTAARCWKIKAEIQRMQQSDKEDSERGKDGKKKSGKKWWKHMYKADKERLIMNLKLCAAMGVNWSLEVASWWFSRGDENSPPNGILPKATWYLSDVANCLHGVFVFMVFVGKKKILAQLWKKLKELSRCCPQVIIGEEGENIGPRGTHSYNTSSLQDINASNDGRTYNFNEDNGKQIGRIQRWLINHGFYSVRKKNSRKANRYFSKASTTTSSISADMSRGNVSYVP